MAENKKVKNATLAEYNGISFKSRLERSCYIRLTEEGFNPEYEKAAYVLVPSILLKNGSSYSPRKKDLIKYTSLRRLTYTPDFEFTYKGVSVYFDAKGKSNDTYPIKKKLFLHYLESLGTPYIFFEPHNLAQLELSISTLYELYGKN